ncbi:MAG: hypothetical protein HY848_03220 [Betaproteobacteria bacterium]|nr:hypothetical protein [Betaproteobacteria bacterium]
MLRTTVGEPRLSQVAENYRAMGFEVHVEYFGDGSAGNERGSSGNTYNDAADKSDACRDWGSVYVRSGRPAGRSDQALAVSPGISGRADLP